MTPQRYKQVKQVFTHACELPEHEVPRYLDEACGEDAALRAEVESLLAYHEPVDPLASSLHEGQSAQSDADNDDSADQATEPVSGSWVSQETVRRSKARFAPGTVIGKRYRIVSIQGQGAMGEVYLADDLTLDQPVALKFLNPQLADKPGVLERFRKEVRLARQVTHPNVARVYDLLELEGEAVISMEYVDGENLSSVVRRVGRLMQSKVIDIARQLCSGLAAAHEQGVLHRDLKPGNIMLDSQGRVRITDFGIAAFAAEAQEKGILPGTPAYMAPEVLQGREATVKSDLYSLGLVLYEMLTGEQAFPNRVPGLIPHEKSPTQLRDVVIDLDPRLGQAVAACTQAAPAARPSSAYEVIGMLPGGDPLAEALAAGQTPSPDLVANAEIQEGLRSGTALVFFSLGMAALVAIIALADWTYLVPQAGLNKSPQILAYDASQIIGLFADHPSSVDEMYGFDINRDYLEHWRSQLQTNDAPPADPAQAITFWLKRSNTPMVTATPITEALPLTPDTVSPGDVTVSLDGEGRLLLFLAVPRDTRPDNAGEVDWSLVFGYAGLEFEEFLEVAPDATPPVFAETVKVWSGPDTRSSTGAGAASQVRVEAGATGDHLVYFRVVPDWQGEGEASANSEQMASRMLGLFLFVMTLLGAVALAQRNVALGRVDYRGALRVAAYGFGVLLLAWLFLHRHVPALQAAAEAIYLNLAMATFYGLIIWVFYIALEPLVRRFWPETIISWSRLVQGRFFDPLVGRDLLVGCLYGAGAVLLFQIDAMLPFWLDLEPGLPIVPFVSEDNLNALLGPGRMLGQIFALQFDALRAGLLAFMLMLLLRVSLRGRYMAALVFVVVIATTFTIMTLGRANLPWVVNTIVAVLLAIMVLRGGVLQVVISFFVFLLLISSPVTSNLSQWYAGPAMVSLCLVAAMLALGFYTALAGRPVFRSYQSPV